MRAVLGHVGALQGAGDLVTIDNWAYSPTYSLPNWPRVGCSSCKSGYTRSYKQSLP